MTDYFDYDNYVHVMCENGQVLGTPIVMLGKHHPDITKEQALDAILK
jgi:hypothetical protein